MFNTMLRAGRVAELFGVDLKTIHNWEAAGKFPKSVRSPGNHRFYSRALVAAELQKLGLPVPVGLSAAMTPAAPPWGRSTKPRFRGTFKTPGSRFLVEVHRDGSAMVSETDIDTKSVTKMLQLGAKDGVDDVDWTALVKALVAAALECGRAG